MSYFRKFFLFFIFWFKGKTLLSSKAVEGFAIWQCAAGESFTPSFTPNGTRPFINGS